MYRILCVAAILFVEALPSEPPAAQASVYVAVWYRDPFGDKVTPGYVTIHTEYNDALEIELSKKEPGYQTPRQLAEAAAAELRREHPRLEIWLRETDYYQTRKFIEDQEAEIAKSLAELKRQGSTAHLDRGKLRAQLIRHERKVPKMYLDSEQIPTIGVGFNLNRADAESKIKSLGFDYADVRAGKAAFNDTQIDTLLNEDIETALSDCRSVFNQFDTLSDVRQRVLTDMMFNLGKTKFVQFQKLIDAVKRNDFDAAATEMVDSKWYKQVGTRSKTLVDMMRTNRE